LRKKRAGSLFEVGEHDEERVVGLSGRKGNSRIYVTEPSLCGGIKKNLGLDRRLVEKVPSYIFRDLGAEGRREYVSDEQKRTRSISVHGQGQKGRAAGRPFTGLDKHMVRGQPKEKVGVLARALARGQPAVPLASVVDQAPGKNQ